MAHIADEIEERARKGDGPSTVAYGLLQVAEALKALPEAMRSDHPLQGETFDGLEEALTDIGVHLKYLGNGDAATTMGAIENLAVQIKEGFENLASALRELATDEGDER